MPLYCNDNNRSTFVGFTALLKLSTANVSPNVCPTLCPLCTTVQMLCALGGDMHSCKAAVGN